jgi:hypothetical protein
METVPGPEKVSHENQQREYKMQLWPEKHSKRGALSDPCKVDIAPRIKPHAAFKTFSTREDGGHAILTAFVTSPAS